eukprot:TRINITY_DN2073_c0_g1_i1.p1 TRINITY_DN2073_c0_g1~~TRINITY_DN2073_c0_g1_i1.p1  ORF type:complete len:1607 (-),score=601.13 TRINITY_DN2073_c0_g1_i1:75-4895(-)
MGDTDTKRCVLRGPLGKLGRNGILWHTRHFTLFINTITLDPSFEYRYKAEDEFAASIIPVECFDAVQVTKETGRPHTFKLFNSTNKKVRVYFLAAESDDDLQVWVRTFSKIFDRRKNKDENKNENKHKHMENKDEIGKEVKEEKEEKRDEATTPRTETEKTEEKEKPKEIEMEKEKEKERERQRQRQMEMEMEKQKEIQRQKEIKEKEEREERERQKEREQALKEKELQLLLLSKKPNEEELEEIEEIKDIPLQDEQFEESVEEIQLEKEELQEKSYQTSKEKEEKDYLDSFEEISEKEEAIDTFEEIDENPPLRNSTKEEETIEFETLEENAEESSMKENEKKQKQEEKEEQYFEDFEEEEEEKESQGKSPMVQETATKQKQQISSASLFSSTQDKQIEKDFEEIKQIVDESNQEYDNILKEETTFEEIKEESIEEEKITEDEPFWCPSREEVFMLRSLLTIIESSFKSNTTLSKGDYPWHPSDIEKQSISELLFSLLTSIHKCPANADEEGSEEFETEFNELKLENEPPNSQFWNPQPQELQVFVEVLKSIQEQLLGTTGQESLEILLISKTSSNEDNQFGFFIPSIEDQQIIVVVMFSLLESNKHIEQDNSALHGSDISPTKFIVQTESKENQKHPKTPQSNINITPIQKSLPISSKIRAQTSDINSTRPPILQPMIKIPLSSSGNVQPDAMKNSREKAIFHDELPIPAQRDVYTASAIRTQTDPSEFYNEEEEELSPSSLTSSDLSLTSDARAIFGDYAIACLYESHRAFKAKGIELIQKRFEEISFRKNPLDASLDTEVVVKSVILILNRIIVEQVPSLFFDALKLLETLVVIYEPRFDVRANFIACRLSVVLTELVKKLGDGNSRIRENSKDLLKYLSKYNEAYYPFVLSSTIFYSNTLSVRQWIGRLEVLLPILESAEALTLSENASRFLLFALEQGNQQIRTSTLRALLLYYKLDPKGTLKLFSSLEKKTRTSVIVYFQECGIDTSPDNPKFKPFSEPFSLPNKEKGRSTKAADSSKAKPPPSPEKLKRIQPTKITPVSSSSSKLKGEISSSMELPKKVPKESPPKQKGTLEAKSRAISVPSLQKSEANSKEERARTVANQKVLISETQDSFQEEEEEIEFSDAEVNIQTEFKESDSQNRTTTRESAKPSALPLSSQTERPRSLQKVASPEKSLREPNSRLVTAPTIKKHADVEEGIRAVTAFPSKPYSSVIEEEDFNEEMEISSIDHATTPELDVETQFRDSYSNSNSRKQSRAEEKTKSFGSSRKGKRSSPQVETQEKERVISAPNLRNIFNPASSARAITAMNTNQSSYTIDENSDEFFSSPSVKTPEIQFHTSFMQNGTPSSKSGRQSSSVDRERSGIASSHKIGERKTTSNLIEDSLLQDSSYITEITSIESSVVKPRNIFASLETPVSKKFAPSKSEVALSTTDSRDINQESPASLLHQRTASNLVEKSQQCSPDSHSRSRTAPEKSISQTLNANVCPFCEQEDDRLADEESRLDHFCYDCPMMSECICGQVIETAYTKEHLLTECGLSQEVSICEKCQMAIHISDTNHSQICPGKPSRDICPLCMAILPNGKYWKTHLTKECPNNQRRFVE